MSEPKVLNFRNYYEISVRLDEGIESDNEPISLALRVRRFTVAELQEFQRGFVRLTSPTAERFIYRRPDGDEQQLREDGRTYVVPATEVERRRLQDMPPEQRALYDAAVSADDEFMTTFCTQQIAKHVSIPPNLNINVLHDDDGAQPFQVKTGRDLVEAFGGNLSFLVRLTRAIHQENTLTSEAKKVLRSLSDSTASSPAPKGNGVTPAATAGNAGTSASAPTGDASGALGQIQSGLMAN